MRPPSGDAPDAAWLAEAGAEVAAAVRGGRDLPELRALAAPGPAWQGALDALDAVVQAGVRAGAESPAVPSTAPPAVVGPAAGSPAARLLAAVAGFPGSGAQDLRDLCLLDGPGFAAASAELLQAGLVESSRFDVPDCWVLTARGRAARRA